MFLSTENPPNDPLSSSSPPPLFHLSSSSSHDLAQSHLSNFSIRDYAYSNRKTNIKKNWPFSAKSLQLISTHGVTDPLPPFQKFSTLRNQFETCSSSSSSRNQIVSYVQAIAETTSNKGVFINQSKIIENGLFTTTSVSKSDVEIVTSKKNNLTSKKCGRGMVKSKEDTCVGLVTTSESTMASKICPICRTFSSASNTTLNAHIDQCLSVESVLPPVTSSKPSKSKAKPQMKVKTMVDIYASAKGCTLADLDKRNGTKWASILSCTNRVVADKSQVSKKRKLPPVGVGPVYVDAKGQKLRILSEFSEKKATTSSTPVRELREDGSKKNKCLSQGSKGNNKSSRKTRMGKKPLKYVKLPNHKANPSEIPEYQRRFSGEGSSAGHRRIYNQRMLGKHGPISKKLTEKGHKFYAERDQSSENDDDSWSEETDPTVLRGSATVSSPLNEQKLRRICGGGEVAGRSKSLCGSKRSENEELLAGAHINSPRGNMSLASSQGDKYPRGKRFCSNAWRLSIPVGKVSATKANAVMALQKDRLDFSDKEDDEETEKWEYETTQEREMSESDDNNVSCDNGETNEVLLRSNQSPRDYDNYDDDEESSEDEEDDTEGANVLDKTDDIGAEFYQSDTPPSTENIPSEREMYYSEEVGNMTYGQNTCEEDVRFSSEVGQRSLFVEVDTIPIPGPPGSFLPSPRDMGFDDNLGNSSVITSQVQSSMDHLDRNSSESPVSAVSNFAAGRLNFPTELSSSIRENFASDITASNSTTPLSFGVPSLHRKNAETEPITNGKTTPSRFRNNDYEPCCCQRKERISEGITLNHQASHLLQRRAASSSTAMNLTRSPTCLNPKSPFEQSPYTSQQDLDLQSKFSSRTTLNSPVPPSPSNPVLRLMGKDLMVMNQGEADEAASRSSLKPTPQSLDPPPCAGTGLYFNTDLYLRNSFESTHQPHTPKTQAQASAFRNNFDHLRYFSPS